jgi:hypothetical protein
MGSTGFRHYSDAPNAPTVSIHMSVVAGEISNTFVEREPEASGNREVGSVSTGWFRQAACGPAVNRRRAKAPGAFIRARRFGAINAVSFVGKFFSLILFGARAKALPRPVARQGQRTL